MIHRLARCLSVGLLALVLSPASRADQVTIGNVNSGEVNAFPFSGSYQDAFGATEYQQVYAGSLIGGPLTISAIAFYSSTSFPGTNADGTYTLSLSTTSAAVGALSTNFSSNIGPDNETFFSGSLPPYPTGGGTMTFTLATPFSFNPALGNLLLDIKISGVTNDSTAVFVAQDGDFGSASSRMVNGLAEGTTGYGLVTTFTVGAAGTVPEPGTLSLAMTGMAAVAGLLWRPRRPRS
jgi:hypothetical protein